MESIESESGDSEDDNKPEFEPILGELKTGLLNEDPKNPLEEEKVRSQDQSLIDIEVNT